MHSFGGNKETTESLLKLGNNINFYFSFSMGILDNLENLNNIPIDKIVLETDAPYQLN